MDILLTEVTMMKDRKVCVAAWCPAESRMVRPLSGTGQYWSEADARPGLLWPGNMLRVEPTGEPGGRGLPHSREDMVIRHQVAIVGQLKDADLLHALRTSESISVLDLFAGRFRWPKFVDGGSDCPSLGAVRSHRLGFDDDDGTLRCWFYDPAGKRYKFAVVGIALKNAFNEEGVRNLNARVARAGEAHIRLGLAHPYPDGACTVLVNNVIFG